jgi:hypothetical protein
VQNQYHWDSRALAYAAGFFRNQLKLEGKWEDLKQVVAVNILGKEASLTARESDPWRNCLEEIFHHYAFTNVINYSKPKHTIQDFQLIQYCVLHLDKSGDESFLEWATFLQSAMMMTEAAVGNVKSERLKLQQFVYYCASLSTMPREVKKR